MLFYPDTIKGYQQNEFRIVVKDELAKDVEVVMKAYQLPIINKQLFDPNCEHEAELNQLFKETRVRLIGRINAILALM